MRVRAVPTRVLHGRDIDDNRVAGSASGGGTDLTRVEQCPSGAVECRIGVDVGHRRIDVGSLVGGEEPGTIRTGNAKSPDGGRERGHRKVGGTVLVRFPKRGNEFRGHDLSQLVIAECPRRIGRCDHHGGRLDRRGPRTPDPIDERTRVAQDQAHRPGGFDQTVADPPRPRCVDRADHALKVDDLAHTVLVLRLDGLDPFARSPEICLGPDEFRLEFRGSYRGALGGLVEFKHPTGEGITIFLPRIHVFVRHRAREGIRTLDPLFTRQAL